MCTGVEIAIAVGALAAAGGTGYAAYDSHEQGVNARENQKRAEARQRQVQAQRESDVAKVRAAYGEGNDPTAQANQKRISDYLSQLYEGQLQSGLRSVDDQFASARRTSRQNLARVGQLGSSLDSSNQQQTLSDYLRARQKAIVDAAGAKDNLASRLAQQREGLVSSVMGGQQAAPDASMLAQQQQQLFSGASQQAPQAAIGHLFNVAGQSYFNGRLQDAAGNAGVQAFGLNSSNGGRIS